jgi:nuclear protein localization protein 4 homolog
LSFIANPNNTFLSFREKVAQEIKEDLSKVRLSRMIGTSLTQLRGDTSTLMELGIKHLELLVLDLPTSSSESTDAPSKLRSSLRVNKKGEIVQEVIQEAEIQEDDIDKQLHKEDGWIETGDVNSSAKKIGDFIAPWDILKHEPWKSEDIYHIPFHSWSRSPKANFDALSYRIPKGGKWSWKQKEVRVERQEYRHIDNIVFQHSSIAHNFIQAWVNTGMQQYGFLYGRYEINKKNTSRNNVPN